MSSKNNNNNATALPSDIELYLEAQTYLKELEDLEGLFIKASKVNNMQLFGQTTPPAVDKAHDLGLIQQEIPALQKVLAEIASPLGLSTEVDQTAAAQTAQI